MAYFIYTLSFEGKVFYVGMSSNLLQRYRSHCSNSWEPTHNYIYWIKYNNKLPDITIVYCTYNKVAAMDCERTIINYLVLIGNKLCNTDSNPIHNQIIQCNPYPLSNKPNRITGIIPIVNAAIKEYQQRNKFDYSYKLHSYYDRAN